MVDVADMQYHSYLVLFLSAIYFGAAECVGAKRRFTHLARGCGSMRGPLLRSRSTGEPRTDRTSAELLALSETADPVAHAAAHTVVRMQEHAEPPVELQR